MTDERTGQRGTATIYHVAARAGVSISTVSLALNAPDRLRPDTLERVQSAMRDLNFVPKAEAAIRARKGTRRIGVVGRFSAIPSESDRLRGILAAAAEESYDVVLYDEAAAAFHLHLIDSLSLSRKLDGLILVDLPITDHLAARLEQDGLPTVLIEYPRSGLSCVGIDNVQGGRLAAEYLAGRGHCHCAFLGLVAQPNPLPGYPSLDELRLQGFREGLSAAGLDLPPEYVQRASISPSSREQEPVLLREATYEAAAALLCRDPRPSAIFANFDLLATVVLEVARQRGLRVPDDLAVVGFDDCYFAAFLGLTTVRQHLSESGRVAFQLLHEDINRKDSTVPRTVVLPLRLIARSTA